MEGDPPVPISCVRQASSGVGLAGLTQALGLRSEPALCGVIQRAALGCTRALLLPRPRILSLSTFYFVSDYS